MREGRYYTPKPVRLPLGDGMTVRPGYGCRSYRQDYYSGDLASLVAAGLADADMFPGQPGRPVAVVSYRPLGVERVGGKGWFHVPGYMTIFRLLSGGYRIALTVSRAEFERRRCEPDDEPDDEPEAQRDPTPEPDPATMVQHYERALSVLSKARDAELAKVAARRANLRLVWSAPV